MNSNLEQPKKTGGADAELEPLSKEDLDPGAGSYDKSFLKEFFDKNKVERGTENKLGQGLVDWEKISETLKLGVGEKHLKSEESNIHNRLYMDSKYSRRLNSTNRPNVVHSKKVSSINYGELLYQESKASINTMWKKNITIKLSLQETQDKELTFHPQLPHKDVSTQSISSDVFNRSKLVARNPDRYPSDRHLQECSFKPKINSNVQSTGNIHNKLYMQAVTKQNSNRVVETPKTKVVKKDSCEREACITRLLNSHKFNQAKINKKKNKIESEINLNTNQHLFSPKIGRQPILTLEKPASEKSSGLKITESPKNAPDIYKLFRQDQYKQLFDILDTDSDGKILLNSISQSEVNLKTLKLLHRILGPSNSSIQIDLNTFSDLIEKSINYLPMEDRTWLLRRSKNADTAI